MILLNKIRFLQEYCLFRKVLLDNSFHYTWQASYISYSYPQTTSQEDTSSKSGKPQEQQADNKKGQKQAPAEKVWTNKAECDEAEAKLQERLAQVFDRKEKLRCTVNIILCFYFHYLLALYV